MKYIDADKLIAEIERRIEEYNIQSLRGAELSDLLSFITSLQQEQPEPTCKSCGFYENNFPFIRNTFKPYPNRACKDYTYSVMKEQEQPSLPSNLDEAAQRIAYDVCKQLPNGEEKDGIVYYAILAAIAGAEWMAGQISKAE